jgi:hypothetical protein
MLKNYPLLFSYFQKIQFPNILKISFFLLLFSNISYGQVLNETFDNDTKFTKNESFFTDGSGDYFGIFDSVDGSTNDFDNNPNNTPSSFINASGGNGNYLIGEDLDSNGGSITRVLTWANLNISGFTNLNISVLLAAGTSGFDAADGLTFSVNIDGAGFIDVIDFQAGGDGANEPLTNGAETLGLAFQTITENISGTGASMDLKLTVIANSGNEEFAVDDIVINGTASSDPTIGFDAATSSETETDDTFNVSIPITVSNYGTDQIDVSVAVSGSAEVADYTLNTASLSFTSDGSQNISLDVNPDTDDYDDETIILTLTQTSSISGLVISQSTHTLTLADDETAPSIGFDAATSSETETDETFTSANIPITVSDFSDVQIDINVSVTGGTAEAGDYTFTSPTALSFTTNETQNITVDINDDIDTDEETIILTITETSAVSGLVISQSTHTVTITDDEIPPVPTAGTVFITEILDSNNGYNNDYLELFNNSNEAVSLYNSKLIMFSSTNSYQSTYDFGEEGISSGDITIPAYGFLIITRGNTRDQFNTANSITLDADVNFNSGNSNLYFGTGRRWKLKTGGTANTDDGVLIDDTNGGVGSNKDYRNIFTDTFISGSSSEGTPGSLEYLVYNGDSWVNSDAMSSSTGTKDAYFYSNFAISSDAEANAIGVDTGITVTLNAAASLDVNGDLTINGNGSLSIDSGSSLIVSGTSSGNVTYNRTIDFVDGNLKGWYLLSSPVVGQDYNDDYVTANDIASNGTNRGIATYTTASDSWAYHQGAGSGSFIAGKGYSLKRQTNTGTVSFTGTLNTNDAGVDVTLDNTGNRYNLLGNPYTSSISSATLLGNGALSETQTIWIYDQTSGTNGAYAVSTLVGNFILAPGQGFFVKANEAGGTVNFSEANQSHSVDTFQKSANTEIKLKISVDGFQNYAKIYYLDKATKGFDVGYEGEIFGGSSDSFSIYSQLLSDNKGKKYQVQSLPNSDFENMVIPIGVKATAGKEITLTADALNLPEGIKVFLEDREENTFTRLDELNASYKITTTSAINGVGRFYLHTTQSVLNINDAALDNVSVFKVHNSLRIVGLQQGKAAVKLFNVLGKQVLNTAFESNGTKDISLPSLAKGVYIVQLETVEGKLNKKIILE